MRKSRTTRIGMSHARHDAKRDAARRCDGKCMVRGNSDALPRREAGVQWTAMIKATVPDIFAPSMTLALRAPSLRSALRAAVGVRVCNPANAVRRAPG